MSVLVGVACVKGASFVGVPAGSSTLDPRHPDQEGRSYAERAGRCGPTGSDDLLAADPGRPTGWSRRGRMAVLGARVAVPTNRVVVGRPAGVPECSGGPGAEAVAHYPFVGTPAAADTRMLDVRTPSGERGHEIACPRSPYGVRGSGHRRRETGSPAIRTMPGRSRGLGHLLGTGDVQYQVPAHQYMSQAPAICRSNNLLRPLRVEGAAPNVGG